MALLDTQAADFVASYGEKLRRVSFKELCTDLPESLLQREADEEEREIPAPESLGGYHFTLSRVRLRDGSVRVLVRGSRPALAGLSQVRVLNAFDMQPDGKVIEIPKSDEDYCG